MTNMLENAQVSRRTFMKGSALAGLGAAAMGTGAVSLFGCSPSADGAKGNDAATQAVEETTTWGHCAINCPGRCSLKFHVQDDEVAWVETYTSKDAGFDEVQPRACLRGRTYRRWLANPDRINYPMKRVGKRGEGKFEQISLGRSRRHDRQRTQAHHRRVRQRVRVHSLCDGRELHDGALAAAFHELPRRFPGVVRRLQRHADGNDRAPHLRRIRLQRQHAQRRRGRRASSSRSARARPRRARAAPCRTTTGCICARPRRAR